MAEEGRTGTDCLSNKVRANAALTYSTLLETATANSESRGEVEGGIGRNISRASFILVNCLLLFRSVKEEDRAKGEETLFHFWKGRKREREQESEIRRPSRPRGKVTIWAFYR